MIFKKLLLRNFCEKLRRLLFMFSRKNNLSMKKLFLITRKVIMLNLFLYRFLKKKLKKNTWKDFYEIYFFFNCERSGNSEEWK